MPSCTGQKIACFICRGRVKSLYLINYINIKINMKTNIEVRYAAAPRDFKNYDTARLREDFMIKELFTPDSVNMVYTMYDRLIVGGVMPVAERVKLETVDILRAEYFAQRREIGIINSGGSGIVRVDGTAYEIDHKEALYIGRGCREIVFESKDGKAPAKFYFNSAPAHKEYPCRKVTRKDAVILELGSLEESNHRVINRLIVQEVVPTCQLQMGMTELKPGSVWNTMPPHTHDRRMEAYYYFDIDPSQAVCHFMGPVDETRHIWLGCDDAVISPSWSVHSACATQNYSFVWGMCGENLDYGDMDAAAVTDLK